eukprot:3728229-Pleurochrysis_carterae.AAC.2
MVASLFLAPVAPVVLLLCVACNSPMRFLVHASGERMFGLSLPGGAPFPRHTALSSSVRAALLDALKFPLQALDACASPFLVVTTNRAAVAVAPVAASTGMSPSARTVKG